MLAASKAIVRGYPNIESREPSNNSKGCCEIVCMARRQPKAFLNDRSPVPASVAEMRDKLDWCTTMAMLDCLELGNSACVLVHICRGLFAPVRLLFVCLSHPSIYLSVSLSIVLPFHLSTCPSDSQSTCLSVYLSIHLTVCHSSKNHVDKDGGSNMGMSPFMEWRPESRLTSCCLGSF